MVFEFKTPRNTNGHRKYLYVNTDTKLFSRECPRMIVEGIEIKTRDYNALINDLKAHGFTEEGQN